MSAVSPVKIKNGQKYVLKIAITKNNEGGVKMPAIGNSANDSKCQDDSRSYSSLSDSEENVSSDYLSPDEILGSPTVTEYNVNADSKYNSYSENKTNRRKTVSEGKTPKKNPENKNNRYPSTHLSVLIDNNENQEEKGEENFPQEAWKTFLSFVLMVFCFILTVVSLCLTHDRLPDNGIRPLPDVILDNIPFSKRALNVSEYIIIFCLNSAVVVLIIHKHRFIVCRRIFFIMAMLYFYRAVTMYVTVLPIANKMYPCAPKSDDPTWTGLMQRVVRVMSGLGLSVNGKHVYCGDFIFSGHTVILTLSALVISEYTPRALWVLHYFYWFLCWLGIVMLEFAHGHYTIDIIIAYFVTTRLFWLYHVIANYVVLKQRSMENHLSRLWWHKMFLFFEQNVRSAVPNEYNWPFVCRKREHTDFG